MRDAEEKEQGEEEKETTRASGIHVVGGDICGTSGHHESQSGVILHVQKLYTMVLWCWWRWGDPGSDAMKATGETDNKGGPSLEGQRPDFATAKTFGACLAALHLGLLVPNQRNAPILFMLRHSSRASIVSILPSKPTGLDLDQFRHTDSQRTRFSTDISPVVRPSAPRPLRPQVADKACYSVTEQKEPLAIILAS
jgi:hypothetical protein